MMKGMDSGAIYRQRGRRISSFELWASYLRRSWSSRGRPAVMAQAGGVARMREASRGGSVAAEAGSRRVEAAKAALRGSATFLGAKLVAAEQTGGEGCGAPFFQ